MVGRVTLNGWKREERPIASRSGHFLQSQRDPISERGTGWALLRRSQGMLMLQYQLSPIAHLKHALAYQTLPLALIKLDLFMGGFSVD
jgi:hypothetical protein